MDGHADSQLLPGFFGGVGRKVEDHCQGEAGAVSKGEAEMAGFGYDISGNSCLSFVERYDFTDGTGGVFPGLRGSPTTAHEFGLNFGEIDGAGYGAGEQIGSQLVRARLIADDGENGGSVEDDPIHIYPDLFAPCGSAALGK